MDEREGGGEDEAVGQDLHELHVGERPPARGGEVRGGGEAGGQGARGRVWEGGGQSRASPAAQLVGAVLRESRPLIRELKASPPDWLRGKKYKELVQSSQTGVANLRVAFYR